LCGRVSVNQHQDLTRALHSPTILTIRSHYIYACTGLLDLCKE